MRAGEIVMQLVADDLRPSKILTRAAFDNAITAVAATAGSTNAVLHLLAIAREAGIALTHRRLRRHLGEDADAGRRRAGRPLHGVRSRARGRHSPGGARGWLEAGLLKDSMTVSGRSILAEAAEAKETPGQEVVRPLDKPMSARGAASRSCAGRWRPRARS